MLSGIGNKILADIRADIRDGGFGIIRFVFGSGVFYGSFGLAHTLASFRAKIGAFVFS